MRSKFMTKIFYNWQVKILCFLVALFVYFMLVYSVQASRSVVLPVEVALPEGYTAESTVPDSVELVMMGTEDRIYMIDVSKISLSVDFSTVNHEGISYATVNIDSSGLERFLDTSGVSIYTKPSQLKVYFSKDGE